MWTATWLHECQTLSCFKKFTRHTYGNEVVKLYIQFNFPKYNVLMQCLLRIVVMACQRQRFLCQLRSFRLELHNNWKRRESIFVLLVKNWACPTVSDNELHMPLFRCDGELHYGEGVGCAGFCLYSRPICKMVVPEMMYSILWLIATIFCWNMTADATYLYGSIFYWKVRKCVQLLWNCSSLWYVFLKSHWI